MAIFDPARQGGVQAPNAMFAKLNEQMQAYREAQQVQREQQAMSKLREQGLLGVKTAGLFDATTGKINLGAGDAMTTKEHYDALSKDLGDKEMRKVFGRTATADDVKSFIKGEQRKRDLEILNAIDLRMKELNTDNIYKVIEKGDSSFKDWYNTTDQETKLKLLEAGYHPELKEGFGTIGMERRRAQGKSAIPGYGLLAGAGAVGAGAYFGRDKIANLAKSYRGKGVQQLQYGLGQMARDIDAGKLSAEEAQRIIREMKKGTSKEGKSILNKIPKSLRNPKQLVRAIGKQAPILGAFSPGQIVGEELAEGVGLGETGQALGGLAGGTATATAMARALPALIRGAGKVVPHPIAKGALTALGVGSGALLDYLLND